MKVPTNGTWKTLAVIALAAFQALCFSTLLEIKTDIRETMRRQSLTDIQLALIAVRHAAEDVPQLKPKTI